MHGSTDISRQPTVLLLPWDEAVIDLLTILLDEAGYRSERVASADHAIEQLAGSQELCIVIAGNYHVTCESRRFLAALNGQPELRAHCRVLGLTSSTAPFLPEVDYSLRFPCDIEPIFQALLQLGVTLQTSEEGSS